MATGNTSFDTLASSTIDAFVPTLVDNVFSSKPFLWILQNGGHIGNKDGGLQMNLELLYAESKNVGSYSGSDTFATEDDDEITVAEFPWKQYYGLFKIDGITEAKNSGSKTKILDILKTRAKVVEMTISENLDKMFLGDGTGNGGKDFYGLKKLVGTGDLGNITVSDNAWWKSTVDTTSESLATYGLSGMSTMFNTVSEGNDHPTHILTDMDEFGAFEALLTSNARYLDPNLADAGFQNLLFKGVPITFDNYVDGGYMYFLNMDYIEFNKLNNVWFTPSEFVTPANQDVRYKYLKLYGQLGISNRKRQGLHTGLTD